MYCSFLEVCYKMQAWKAWRELFNRKHFIEHYNEKILTHPSVGLDKITPTVFHDNLESNIELILKKTQNKTYKFTRYKQILFSKGADKPPRCVNVPTLRDKLTISVLNELIQNVYGETCITPMPHMIINEITQNLNKYTHFIKIDIESFYATIDQDILINTLNQKIRKDEISLLISNAIKTSSLPCTIQTRSTTTINEKGIPEGLAISNSLANLYMANIDQKYRAITNIKYWRYVDDILLFVNESDFKQIKNSILEDISKLNLKPNNKQDEGEISKGFTYLGYNISSSLISIRERSILKMEQSIENLFQKIKSQNNSYIEWKVNLKITGFIIDNHKYGWIFFYSQINDISLLYHLDNLIKKFVKRYKISSEIKFKRFVRTYHEIRQALHKTKYIPNIDLYSIDDKKDILFNIYGENVEKLNEEQIRIKFSRIMAKEIQDVEKDIQDIS